MSGLRKDAWSDGAMLEALYLRDVERLSVSVVAKRLDVSTSAAAGAFYRVRHDEAPGRAGNGTMPSRWWVAGLEARA